VKIVSKYQLAKIFDPPVVSKSKAIKLLTFATARGRNELAGRLPTILRRTTGHVSANHQVVDSVCCR